MDLNSYEKQEKVCGIYRIFNKKNGKMYVGQSVDIYLRIRRHLRQLKGLNGKYHDNRYLQSDWDEFGMDSFTIEIIERLPTATKRETLRKKEEKYINENLKLVYNYSSHSSLEFRKQRSLGGRIRKYASNAEKQKAYRLRKAGKKWDHLLLNDNNALDSKILKKLIPIFISKAIKVDLNSEEIARVKILAEVL